MKKFLSLTAFAMLLFASVGGFTACGGDDDDNDNDKDNTATTDEDNTDTGDKSSFKNQTVRVGDVEFTMVAVAGGTFQMGAWGSTLENAKNDEFPVHEVTLSDYYIGATKVTQALWEAVMGSNPSNFKGATLPVEEISWNDCQTFIEKLNQLTGKTFRLPTEAEWEYAARGGNKSNNYTYSGSDDIGAVAWYDGNSNSQTHPVGQKLPNELGLYDMSGNVWEWCRDWYGSYSSEAQTNPAGAASGSDRVCRGGGWNNGARGCRVSNRGLNSPDYHYCDLGLRLVLQFP